MLLLFNILKYIGKSKFECNANVNFCKKLSVKSKHFIEYKYELIPHKTLNINIVLLLRNQNVKMNSAVSVFSYIIIVVYFRRFFCLGKFTFKFVLTTYRIIVKGLL